MGRRMVKTRGQKNDKPRWLLRKRFGKIISGLTWQNLTVCLECWGSAREMVSSDHGFDWIKKLYRNPRCKPCRVFVSHAGICVTPTLNGWHAAWRKMLCQRTSDSESGEPIRLFWFQVAGQCPNFGCFPRVSPVTLYELGSSWPKFCGTHAVGQKNLIVSWCKGGSTAYFHQSGVAIPSSHYVCQNRMSTSSIGLNESQSSGNNADVLDGE